MIARTVLLYGRSLLLSGVAAGLEECPGLEVVRAATWPDACRLLAERQPEVVIFDRADDCATQLLPLLLKSPHLVMVGLDGECNQAVLVSGREARSLTLQQIQEIVETGAVRQVQGAALAIRLEQSSPNPILEEKDGQEMDSR